jgi:hypothetical protein
MSESQDNGQGAVEDDHRPPRFYANLTHVSPGPFDLTLTFLVADYTALPAGNVGPHQTRISAEVQIVMPIGHAKAMLPLLSRAIQNYEGAHGIIPAPGFDQDSKA